MDDFLKKLNVLVRARLRDAVGGTEPSSKRSRLPKSQIDLDREVAQFRSRLDEAYRYEENLKAQVAALQSEADGYDLAADSALQQGQSDVARQAVESMQRAQRRMALVEADLREHRRAASELLERVNLLEAAAADQKRAAAKSDEQAEASEGQRIVLPSLDKVLQETKDTIDRLADTANAKQAMSAPEPEPQAVADDLERRIERLSRK